MYKIMLVEDEEILAQLIAKNLKQWGYEVHLTKDFQKVLQEFIAIEPHLVIMDIGLPYYNGYHWCKEIRNLSKVPIIFLSSMSQQMNIVMAMDMGGDDFICKPFDIPVLIAKIQAVLRRSYTFATSLHVMEHRGVVLNLNDASLSYDGNRMELTKNEFRILQLLIQNSSKVIAREEIMAALWEDDSYVDDNTLTVNVTRLRKKLGRIGLDDWIQTKKGIGYMVE